MLYGTKGFPCVMHTALCCVLMCKGIADELCMHARELGLVMALAVHWALCTGLTLNE